MTDTGRRALLRIGEALRSDRAYRLRLRRRGSAIAVLIGALGLILAAPIRPLLVWNATPSAPVGLYAVSAPHDVERGDMVIARLSPPWRTLADARRYVPANVPLVKRVATAPGDTACARGTAALPARHLRAGRRICDETRRLVPWWRGFHRTKRGGR